MHEEKQLPEGKMTGTQGPQNISTKQRQIAKIAREKPKTALNTLAHHIDSDWLMEAYRTTRKGGASGIDGQSGGQYAEALEDNLRSLLGRAKSGNYRAPPVRRVYIPKNSSPAELRPLGIPTFEDKILQRAVVMVMQSVYEQDFLNCSYGFRPGRNQHQAIDALRGAIGIEGGWLIEIDIRKYFDTVDHAQLQALIKQRIGDGVLQRLIGKWLNAGVLEDKIITHSDAGTPQGGVISPLLANIYLHEVLDVWFEEQVKPRLRRGGELIRYADDAVLVFKDETDAKRVMKVLGERMAKFGLALHPDKTRLICFRHPWYCKTPPETFEFLGFCFYWGATRKKGQAVKVKTAASRFNASLKRISEWMRDNRHMPIEKQHRMLVLKLSGHFNYYAIRGNRQRAHDYRHEVVALWKKWLSRRSQKARISWQAFKQRIANRYPLPSPAPLMT